MVRLGFKFRMLDISVEMSNTVCHLNSLLGVVGMAVLLLFAANAAVGQSVRNESAFTQSVTRYWLAELGAADAVRLVERQTGGRVLSVNEEERGGVHVYRVKVLLPEGRVRTIFVDKQSGAQREG